MPCKRHPQLIAPESLARLDSPVILDCRFDLADPGKGRRLYAEGHLPGAGFADLDLDLSGPIGPLTGRHPLPDPAALAADWGTGGSTPTPPWSSMTTWGAPSRHVCGGCCAGWGIAMCVCSTGESRPGHAAGGALTAEAPRPLRRATSCHASTLDAWVSTPDLVRLLASGRIQVIDARAPARFRGESEPIDPVAGHIPGAINLPLQGNLGEGGRFLPGPTAARALPHGHRHPRPARDRPFLRVGRQRLPQPVRHGDRRARRDRDSTRAPGANGSARPSARSPSATNLTTASG